MVHASALLFEVYDEATIITVAKKVIRKFMLTLPRDFQHPFLGHFLSIIWLDDRTYRYYSRDEPSRSLKNKAKRFSNRPKYLS